jgi:PadR family transcriptional regulator PadR
VILAALVTGPSHGYDLRESIEEMAGSLLPADPGGIYRLLRRLEEEGLVVSAWADGSSGPRRREYQITQEGLDALAYWREDLVQRRLALRTIISSIDEALARRPTYRGRRIIDP